MISVIIPAKNEPYLDKTVSDVKAKAREEIEILVAHGDDGVNDMRQKINRKVEEAKGDYILKLDAHCMVDEGFDSKLVEAHQPNWVQIPRRYRLDVENCKVIEDGRPPVDYEHIIFQNLVTDIGESKGFFWGTSWEEYAKERKEQIDDTPHFQGSCWFMTKEWYKQNGFLDLAYGGFLQETIEILFNTRKNGGRIVTNKNTWYAHLHKNEEARKWFELDSEDCKHSFSYAYNKWVKDDKEGFISFIGSFPPMPGWPKEWKQILWQS